MNAKVRSQKSKAYKHSFVPFLERMFNAEAQSNKAMEWWLSEHHSCNSCNSWLKTAFVFFARFAVSFFVSFVPFVDQLQIKRLIERKISPAPFML